MKTNPNDLLNQLPIFNESESRDATTVSNNGLTKREYFAAMTLVGVLSGRRDMLNTSQGVWAAEAAVEIADNLINELNKGSIV